jgi:ubiquinone/menaquinone biosynthesis C-methylase UbiE
VESNSVDIITMFHTLHHILVKYEDRLKDIHRILKPGGIFVIKDHDVQTKLDCDNVVFEHFVYSIGEGAAKVDDENIYSKIEPMLLFSADDVTKYLECIGFKKLYLQTYTNPTKTYNGVFQKI